jgi:hypothetical protein
MAQTPFTHIRHELQIHACEVLLLQLKVCDFIRHYHGLA